MTEAVLTDDADGVLVITINRPEARNAVNGEVARGIAAALDALDSHDDLNVGVITGAGGTFCAGMDLKAFLTGERPAVPGRGFGGLTEAPPAKPLIAAVEGYALAGGCEIALSCDLVVAADTAKFGLPEVKRGLVAAAGGLLRLPRRIPYQVAMELALTRGYHFGLVNRLTAAGGALAAARELAVTISANGPLAVRATKSVIAGAAGWPAGEFWDRQRVIVEPVFTSDDAREGALAFAEKRPPRWSGR
jgi:enoyl-CoA hydratase